MAPVNKNILIVCWDFPPNTAIGGRRWAKIAKSLLKMGYAVSVIAKEPKEATGKIPWISEKELSAMALYFCKPGRWSTWLFDYHSPFRAIRIRLARVILSVFYKGTVFDRTIDVEKRLIALCRQVISERQIGTICVTAAPNNLLYYVAKLKPLYPEITILADFRDPWVDAQNYGMQTLPVAKKRQEQAKQDYVFEHVDLITAPNTFLLDEIRQSYKGSGKIRARFRELQHGFDPDDLLQPGLRKAEQNAIRLVYAGTIYMGMDRYLEFLQSAVAHVAGSGGPELEVVLYTNDQWAKKFFTGGRGGVEVKQQIGDRVFGEIAGADFVLIMLSEHNKNYVTSKFYEFLPYRKPYIYIGPEGYVSQKIEKEGLGFVVRQPEDLLAIVSRSDGENLQEGDIQKYTFDRIVKDFFEDL